ncbi:PAS domain-containing protein [Halovenus marina]|uniref:PAS domain-containing protein n=1 Tax=Halovenus marina TaxID=3396621 RepID=UPI003F555009
MSKTKLNVEDYRSVLDSVDNGAFLLDRESTLVYANSRLCDRVDAPVGQFTERPVADLAAELLASDERDQFKQTLRTVLTDEYDEYPVSEQFRASGSTGTELRFSPVRDGGAVVGAVVVVGETTGPSAGRATREQELERYEAIVEASQDVLWMFTADWSEVVYLNSGFEEVWGITAEQLSEDPTLFLEGVHPDDRATVHSAMEILSNGEGAELEFRVNSAEDYGRWVRVEAEPVFEDGELTHIVGFTRDITEQKAYERNLEQTQRRLELALEAADAGVWEFDPDSAEIILHESRQTQVPADETNGRLPFGALLDQIHPDDRETARSTVETAIENGEDFEQEYRMIHDDGQTRWWQSNAQFVTEDEATQRLIGVSIDITDRKEHERRLEESNERLERFAYVASHDLQEPLRTVANYVDILAEDYEDDLDDEAQELIDVAVTATERMHSMINALLDYSRVTTRGSEFDQVQVDEAVGDIVDDLRVLLETHDGTVDCEPLPTVEADGDQIRQVFQNLVKNALEHSTDEPVTITISGEERPDEYRFEVADDGPGIAESQQEKIFRMFKSTHQYQTESQAKGVGLAICDNIVQRHGGEIWVESPPDEGATFVFTLDKQQPDGDLP